MYDQRLDRVFKHASSPFGERSAVAIAGPAGSATGSGCRVVCCAALAMSSPREGDATPQLGRSDLRARDP
jgi:hypothetical protein